MPAPYSYDLRKKAIEAVKRGQRKTEVCRLLKISRNTLDLWLKKEKLTGDYQAITKGRKGRKPKIQDSEKFREFVREHSDKTQKEIAQLWGEELTQQNISYACQKLGITRKKKLTVIKKEMKKNEQNLEKN
jgi:transposase